MEAKREAGEALLERGSEVYHSVNSEVFSNRGEWDRGPPVEGVVA